MTETEKQDARLAMCDERDESPTRMPDPYAGMGLVVWIAGCCLCVGLAALLFALKARGGM
jgi:hypothetical protein